MPVIWMHSGRDSEDNPFFHLTDAQMRSVREPEKGLFIAEGPKVVRTALELGYEPLAMMMRDKMILTEGAELIRRCGAIPIYTGDDETLAFCTGFRLQRAWVLCAFRRQPVRSAEAVLRGASRVAVLENINEPSNVGAIFRSAAALGADAVLLTPSCCDPLHRRAMRVCMGAVLTLPWAWTGRDGGFSLLREQGFFTVGLALRPESVALDDPMFSGREKLALYLGTEDTGLTEETLRQCGALAVIPMQRGIDSLNVGAAAAIALWQLRRKELPAQD